MSTLIARGNWNILKGRLKQRLARWTRDELQFFEGKTDELVGRIQKRAGITRKQIEHRSGGIEEYGCGHH